ncbi:hypothetical protein GCM10009623_26220 [Nocardioides aestuarii]|uniref:Pilus assembly protein CpaE n=1 Tax=Nocardioides aestuarii TaxID=252231 RepID=A0ABW4TRT9_9ACTN
MLTTHLAERLDHHLRGLGRPWDPSPGDRFTVPGRDLDDVFVVAEMTIDVEDLPSGRHVRFNGTTEWALDQIAADEVLWLPWEHQLRDLLGDAFLSLARVDGSFVVTLADGTSYAGDDPETAYALALLGPVAP